MEIAPPPGIPTLVTSNLLILVATNVLFPPSYIFRWGQTNAYHGQAFMRGPEDQGWYERVAGLQA